ncbi:dockerin type I repeat-containing protein [uncultured Ruminococcus sp.]|uniref:dockerin type I repeat-containing protein n=1 Tax=uncultured Ruminococcus sp. TaxID=165186 RepID=UPI0025977138|nr:dockerin type I repeat-containing protein [uncultured Ruminococcus sp.]
MGFLRKITAAVIAGVLLCLAGAGTLSEPVLMPQEHVFAASGETVSETKHYQEKGNQMSDPVWWEWHSTIDYMIVTETYWDDTVGDTVSNSHIRITGVAIETAIMYQVTNSENHADSISLVGSSHMERSTVFVEIPETIEDIPVTEIGKMQVSYYNRPDVSGVMDNIWYVPRVVVPNTLSAIGDIRCVTSNTNHGGNYKNDVAIQYEGTCEQYLSQCKVYTDTPVICTDGWFYGNDTGLGGWNFEDYIAYKGTCAQWKSFCPDYLSTTKVECSDGTYPSDFTNTTTAETTTTTTTCTSPPASTHTTTQSTTEKTTAATITTAMSFTEATTTSTTTAVSKIFITPPDKSLLHVGEEFPLFSTVLSDDVIWYSTNENVATVRINNDITNPGSGLVKIVGTGTVTIVLVYGDRIGSVTFEVPADTGTSEKTVLGDVNLDGRVDITDAVLLNKTCAGVVSLTDAAKKNADCDCDGEVGSNDAVSLMRFLVHLINILPEPDLS